MIIRATVIDSNRGSGIDKPATEKAQQKLADKAREIGFRDTDALVVAIRAESEEIMRAHEEARSRMR